MRPWPSIKKHVQIMFSTACHRLFHATSVTMCVNASPNESRYDSSAIGTACVWSRMVGEFGWAAGLEPTPEHSCC